MNVYKIEPIGFASNTFAVTEDGKSCILIDCAQPHAVEECNRLGLKIEAVFLTHGHYDHIGGLGLIDGIGAPIYCGEGEERLIFSPANRAVFHGVTIPHFKISKTLSDGQKLCVCGLNIEVIATPGHTVGGVTYVIGDAMFTGDTLFHESVGRTDLPTGDYVRLAESIKKLYGMDGGYTVYCGHGEETSLSHERKFNPYVRG